MLVCVVIRAEAQRQKDHDLERTQLLQAESDKARAIADLILQKVFPKGMEVGAPSDWQERLKLVPGEVSLRLRGAAASATLQALALVKSHYPFVDLKRFETGCAAGTSEARFEGLLSEAEPTADVLASFMNIDNLD